jgi:hypothetical protein
MYSMEVRYERPYSHASAWAWRLGLFAVLLFALTAVAHRLGTMETPNFVAVAMLAAALAVLALICGVAGLANLWVYGAKGGRAAFWGMVLAILILLPAGFAAERYFGLPRASDVSTDRGDVPAFLEEPEAAPSWLGEGRRAPPEAYPELTGRRYEGAMDRVLSTVLTIAAEQGITIVKTSGGVRLPAPAAAEAEAPEEAAPEAMESPPAPQPDFEAPVPIPAPRDGGGVLAAPVTPAQPSRVLLQGVVADPVFAIPSDVVIRLIEEAETTRVDMRAVTRYGPHDLGLNAWHINAFLEALDAALPGAAGGS